MEKKDEPDLFWKIFFWPALLTNDPGMALIGCILGFLFWFAALCIGVGFVTSWLIFH